MSEIQTERTSLGLRNALFDTLDQLNAKSVTPQEAQAICKVAAQIINSVNTELEFYKVTKLRGATVEEGDLVLKLGS